MSRGLVCLAVSKRQKVNLAGGFAAPAKWVSMFTERSRVSLGDERD